MKSLRLLDRRAGYSLASIGLLLGMVAPAVIPAFASASGVLGTRSITMSTPAVSATAVGYDLKFTGVADIHAASTHEGGIVIDFCSESPLMSTACTTPTGMSVSGVGVGTVKYAGSAAGSNGSVDGSNASGHTVVWTAGSAYTGGDTFELPLTGITNSSTAGAFYARITTYIDDTALASYTNATTLGTYSDAGAIALSTASNVGVTAYVLESMTFCVSHTAPTANCGGTDTPSLTLGETTGSVTALTPSALSTGTDYAQLSTNAVSGAVVNLHSSTTGCGGLRRAVAPGSCDIAAQPTSDGTTTIAAGTAKFGLTVGSVASASGATSPTGTLAATNGYDGSHYFIDYDSGDATGVTSTYGSPLFNSSSAPVSNKNIPFTFGTSIGNDTPAGVYGATLNLVATGTF